MSEFDRFVDRRNSSSTKWEKYKDRDVIPMWIADMDFKAPQPVIAQLEQRCRLGVYGYTKLPEELVEVFLAYLQSSYSWSVSEQDLVFIPGIVPGLNIACRSLVSDGEAILTATPTYPPLLSAPGDAGRDLIRVPVEKQDGRYVYPIKKLAESITANSRMLLLCNPSNPIGRSLTRDELQGIVALCLKHNLLLCSDEIHCDLVFDGRSHLPVATIAPAIEDSLITLIGPGKTYNLAGIGGAVAIIKNPALREAFIATSLGITGAVSLFSYPAMLAAYRDCSAWREELLAYLQGNRDYLRQRIDEMPYIRMNDVEATYLAWIDVRALKVSDPLAFFEEAGVGLVAGEQYGGAGFMRLNFGCPRSVLATACDRIESALRSADTE